MTRSRRRLTGAVAVVAALVTISACGSSGSSSSSKGSSSGSSSSSASSTGAPSNAGASAGVVKNAKGTITWYANTFGPTKPDVRRELVSDFEKAYPNIHVKLQTEPTDTDTTRSTITTQISGGSSGFDVYNGDVTWPAQFGSKGLALPLNKYFPASYWKQFSPGLISGMTYQGKVMAAPLFTDNAFLFYRKDLLKKAGLPVPTTWEQVKKEGAELQKKGLAKYGFAAEWDSYEGLTCDWTEMATDAGAKNVDSAGKKAEIDSAGAKKALTFMRSMITSGVAPKAITSYQEPDAETLFTTGQVAFLRNWTYAYADSNSTKASKIVGKVGVTNLPTFAGQPKPGYSTTGGWNLYVNPHSKNIPAAIAFVKWMTGAQAQKIIATTGGELPTRAATLADPAVQKSNPVYPVAAKNKLVSRPSQVASYAAVSQAIYSNINAALSGQSSVDSALSKAQSQMNKALGGGGL